MADEYLLMAQYSRAPVVRDRNTSGLIKWSGYVGTEAIPPTPSDEWISLRILSERIVLQPETYAAQCNGYFLQDSNTISHIHDMLNPFNSPTLEADLEIVTEAIIGSFMPRFAASQVTQADIDAWLLANPVTPAAATGAAPQHRR